MHYRLANLTLLFTCYLAYGTCYYINILIM